MKINFYHFNSQDNYRTVSLLLEKIISLRNRVLFYFDDNKLKQEWNKAIWSFSNIHFIPHDTDESDCPSVQPILLTEKITNLNNANVLCLMGNESLELISKCQNILTQIEQNSPITSVVLLLSSDDLKAQENLIQIQNNFSSNAESINYYIKLEKEWKKINNPTN